jgi:hypothetical protein
MARNWMSAISDDLLARLGRGDAPFPTQGFTGSASDLAIARPPPAAPPRSRSTGMFIPVSERLNADDTPVIGRTRFGR